MADDLPLLWLKGITKRFAGGTVANEGVNLSLFEGEVHALIGENGAGKSTLMNIAFGLFQPDEGAIYIRDERVQHHSPADAIAHGLGMVHQHFKLVPSFTVAENLALARFRSLGLYSRPQQLASVVNELAARYGLELQAQAIVGELPLAIQQRVEIAKALHLDARILILDEPTTILTPTEIERLYEIVSEIRAEGRGVVLITHHLDEVFSFSDRVSVLRAGKLVGEGKTATMDRAEVARLIVGREVATAPIERGAHTGSQVEPLLAVEELTVAPNAYSTGLRGASLAVGSGEVVGVAGVEGNGQRELFEVLAGLRPSTSGKFSYRGDERTSWTAREATAAGVRAVPEDRHGEGLFLELNVAENLVVDAIGRPEYSLHGWVKRNAVLALARRLIEQFRVRTPGPTATVRTLSGGNQQKVVLARALRDGPTLLLAHQPTRGLDIGATREVLETLSRSAEQGAGVLLISSNLDEILAVADRVFVMYRGLVVGGGRVGSLTREEIGHWMTGSQRAEEEQ